MGAIAWDGYATDPDPEIHKDIPMWLRLAAEADGPILDVGCATGRVMIPLLEAGHSVDGIDPSEDALDILRRKLSARGLKAKLANQTMQSLDTERQYRLIIVPCGTIQIVLEREEQREALDRFYQHLAPGGRLVMTLYDYRADFSEVTKGAWKVRSERTQPDGTILEKAAQIVDWNLLEQTIEQYVRYRRYRGDNVVQEEICHAHERWYTKHELTLMLERACFRVDRVTGNYTDELAKDRDWVLTFHAHR
jgi:SAM-dependent methyltransferase